MLLLLTSAVLAQTQPAQAPTAVFVSELQPVNKEAGGFAALMTGFLAAELDAHQELSVATADQAPDFGDYSALVYLLSCPPGEYLGCAYVVGDRVNAQYAVAGTVESVPGGNLVHMTIIDVWESREAVSFDVELGLGDDQRFAQIVAEMLIAVVEGEQGAVVDVREMEPGVDPDSQAAKDAATARELAQLAGELGEVSVLTSDRKIYRPEYTMEDLAEDSQSDAESPWETLGMKPEEYLKFKNSGLTVNEWRQRNAGRRGQLLIHGGGGVMRGPLSTEYRGWYAVDGETQVNLEAQAWQARTLSSGATGSLWAGYGLSPAVEVDLGLGVGIGRYSMHIQQEVTGQDVVPREGQDFPQQNVLLGVRVLGAPMPAWRARPVIGGGFVYMLGEGTGDNLLPGEGTNLAVFDSSDVGMAELRLGVELSLSPNLDVFLHLPLRLVVVGGEPMVESSGVSGNLRSYQEPGAVPVLSTGIEIGVTARALGHYEQAEREWELPD